ncbi:MAG: tetratricopeptide repeat protein [Deltaproteobacteria bacterium]|nr:tetratricopeptide repeat protein [Candidatus Zymogenaceae bacterium]
MKSQLVKRSYQVCVIAAFLFAFSLLSAPATFTSDLSDLIAQGDKCFQADDYAKAIEYYEKAVELDPSNYIALLNLGFSLAELERYDESLKCYKKAKEAGAPFKEGFILTGKAKEFYDKGINFIKAKNYQEAIKSFENAIKEDPSNVMAINNIGWIYKNINGDNKKAEEKFKEAIKKNPLFSVAYNSLGKLYYDNKSPQKCILFYSAELEMGISDPVRRTKVENRIIEMKNLR